MIREKSNELVQVALNILSFSREELAVKLGVSPTVIAKWEKDDFVPDKMEKKIREITKLGDKDPELVLLAGGLEEAIKWERLIHHLAATANNSDETGYTTAPLIDELDYICWYTLYTLNEMGITIPKEFPKELVFDYEDMNAEQLKAFSDNPYAEVIFNIFSALTDVYGFYTAYVGDVLFHDNLTLDSTAACNIHPSLLALAACKIEVSEDFAPKFFKFKDSILTDYTQWLTIVKDKALEAGIPMKADPLKMVYCSNDSLGIEAERESLELND